MNDFNPQLYVKRNREVALRRYGNLLDENRKVVGTDIWFDEMWRLHRGDMEEENK